MVEVWLPYGSSEIPARVPEERLIGILQPGKATSPVDVGREVEQQTDSNRILQRAAKQAKRICIGVGVARNHQIMTKATETLIQALLKAGAADGSIAVVQTPDSPRLDFSAIPGVQVVRHSPTSSETVAPQETKTQFSLTLNSTFVNADLRILLGELKPHHFLGHAGLCDIILPGLASEASTQAHLSNRKALAASDLRKERIDVANSLPDLLALGFALDGELAPAAISFGSINECLDDLMKTQRKLWTVKVEKLADIAVVGAGGSPMDESLLSAVETFPAGLNIVKRDGAIIVAAECAMGHGGGEFYEWCAERKEPRHLEARLRHNFSYAGYKAAFLLRAAQGHRIYLVSTIPDYYVENIFGLRVAETVNGALQTIQRSLGSDSTVTLVPDGSAVLPNKTEN